MSTTRYDVIIVGTGAGGGTLAHALAPTGAAEIYGLSILRNDMQDSADNRTRFVLLGRESA